MLEKVKIIYTVDQLYYFYQSINSVQMQQSFKTIFIFLLTCAFKIKTNSVRHGAK